MNGCDLINQVIDELDRSKEILLQIREGTYISGDDVDNLIDNIRMSLELYYENSDSIHANIEDIEIDDSITIDEI